MPRDAFNWTSFWDLTSPELAAVVLTDFYGPAAAEAARQCALAAALDGREDDQRFWIAALTELNGSGETSRRELEQGRSG